MDSLINRNSYTTHIQTMYTTWTLIVHDDHANQFDYDDAGGVDHVGHTDYASHPYQAERIDNTHHVE